MYIIKQFNSCSPGENDRDFAVDVFRCIFVNKNYCILIKISLKFVPKSPIDNKTALVQMYLRLFRAKPLSEPMLNWFTDANMGHYGEMG